VAKAGAEGVQCLGVVGADMGIIIKIEDGNPRAISAAALEVLKQLGIGDEEVYQKLDPYVHPAIYNARGDQIGRIELDFTLEKH
jgi:L-asparaginase II